MRGKRMMNFTAVVLFAAVFCLTGGAFGALPHDDAGLPSEVVFIDPSVRDAEIIVAQLPQGAEVVRLSPGMDGIAQISAHLTEKRDLSAIRIISHGNAGRFVLSANIIDDDYITEKADLIAAWGNSLSENGDIMLYGCNIAATTEGQAFVQHLADLTGADIAAATYATGGTAPLPTKSFSSIQSFQFSNSGLQTTGSGWGLDYHYGEIEAASLTVDGYEYHLANQTVTLNTDTNSSGSGASGDLRYAIANVGDGEEITFNITSGSDIVTILAELNISDSGINPLGAKSMSIDGYNNATGNNVTVKVTTPGTSTYRVFNINASDETVNISNMTTQGGRATDSGGAIYSNDGTVNLDNIIVSDSKTYGNGGGIAIDGGTITVTNSTISDNHGLNNSSTGGGIYASAGTVTITNCTISDNRTVGTSGKGGGISNYGAAMSIINSTISDNTTNIRGGGIFAAGSTNLINSTISNNTANGFYSEGGGIWFWGSSGVNFCILNSVVINNAGNTGADIYISKGTVNAYYSWYKVTSGTIGGSDNNTTAYTASDLGNLAYAGGFTDVSAVASAAATGTPGKAEDGTFAYHNSTDGYYYNSGSEGSPVYRKITDNSIITPSSPSTDLIKTDQRGYCRTTGAITRGAYQYNGIVAKIGDNTNWNTGTFGTDTFATIKTAYDVANDDDIIELAGTAIYESGIALNVDKSVTIRRDDDISTTTYIQAAQTANTASDRVFTIEAGTVTFDDMTIRYGKTTTGGGIYTGGTGTIFINNSIISRNTSENGGGIYNQPDATISITNSTISGNASVYGGGIYNENTISITNSTISGNTASSFGSGIVFIDSAGTATISITNSTIIGNTASSFGSGIYFEAEGTLNVKNTILAGNGTDDYYYGSGTLTDSGYNVVKYSNVAANATGGFNNANDILYNTKYDVAGTDFDSWTKNAAAVSGSLNLSSALALNDSTNGTKTLAFTGESFAAASASTGIPYGSDPYWNNSPSTDQRGVARIASQNTSIGAYSANYVDVSYEYRTRADGDWNCVTPGSAVWQRRPSGSSDAWVDVTNSDNLPTHEDESITVRHNVTVNIDVMIDDTTVDSGGSLIIPTGVTLSIANGTGMDLTVNGTLDMDGGTLTKYGQMTYGASSFLIYSDSSASQTTTTAELPASGAANLTINNSNGVTLGGTTAISGNLTLTSGTFTVGDNNFTATGNTTGSGTISIGTGTVDVDGTFNVTGAVTFTGAGDLKLGGATITSLGTLSTGSGTVWYDRANSQTVLADTYNNLTISGGSSSTKTFGGNIDVNNDLTVAASTTLDTSSSDCSVDVGGNWANSGTFTPQKGLLPLTVPPARPSPAPTPFTI